MRPFWKKAKSDQNWPFSWQKCEQFSAKTGIVKIDILAFWPSVYGEKWNLERVKNRRFWSPSRPTSNLRPKGSQRTPKWTPEIGNLASQTTSKSTLGSVSSDLGIGPQIGQNRISQSPGRRSFISCRDEKSNTYRTSMLSQHWGLSPDLSDPPKGIWEDQVMVDSLPRRESTRNKNREILVSEHRSWSVFFVGFHLLLPPKGE